MNESPPHPCSETVSDSEPSNEPERDSNQSETGSESRESAARGLTACAPRYSTETESFRDASVCRSQLV